MKVNIAMIIVNGKLLLLCKLLLLVLACLFCWSKYISKFSIAYGIMSSKAIERNRAPENVIAVLIIEPYLKHFIPEMNLPKRTTYPKKTNISTIFISKVTYIRAMFKCYYLLLIINSIILIIETIRIATEEDNNFSDSI